MKSREREARMRRIQEGLVRAGAWMLEPTDEHMAAATIVIAQALLDLVALGSQRVVSRSLDDLKQLVKEGVLLP